jgi:hypothetical protein
MESPNNTKNKEALTEEKELTQNDVEQAKLKTEIERQKAEQARIAAQREADLARIKAGERADIEAAEADRAKATKAKREASSQTLDPVSNWAGRLLKSWKTWLGIGAVAGTTLVGYDICTHTTEPDGKTNIEKVRDGIRKVADTTADTVAATGDALEENKTAITNGIKGSVEGTAKTGEAAGSAVKTVGEVLHVYGTPQEREEGLKQQSQKGGVQGTQARIALWLKGKNKQQ